MCSAQWPLNRGRRCEVDQPSETHRVHRVSWETPHGNVLVSEWIDGATTDGVTVRDA